MVAGEPSGDRLGAGLVRELRQRLPDARFVAIGGPKMAEAGCEILYAMDRIGVMGIDGLREKLVDILRIRRQLSNRWSENRPAVFVGIDVPDFNIGLELRLRRAGVPCVHYVSPTVWAWRGYRIHKIRRAVDHMLALFPFEAEYYRRHNVPVTCVGHPLADELGVPDKAAARAKLGLGDGIVIALLPGSRRNEVKRLTEPMIEAARLLYQRDPNISFVLPFASDRVRKTFQQLAADTGDLPLTLVDGRSRQVLESADLAVLASGTASLEAALMGVPHVVVYRLSALSYWLMRRLRQVDYYAMPNHLLPAPMVPELIQSDATASRIVDAVLAYLHNPDRMEEIKTAFYNIYAELKLDADKRAADVVISMIGAED